MNVIESLNEMEKNGSLKVLLAAGIISPKICMYREIFLLVDREIKLGSGKMEAYRFVSDKYDVHVNTIRNAFAAMSK